MNEAINHPKHYNFGTHEVIDVIESARFGYEFCMGNAMKYLARANHKGTRLQDLQKAQWYLKRAASTHARLRADEVSIAHTAEEWGIPSEILGNIVRGFPEAAEHHLDILIDNEKEKATTG